MSFLITIIALLLIACTVDCGEVTNTTPQPTQVTHVAEDINETQTPTVIPTPIPSIEKLEAEVVAIQQSLGEDRLAYERGDMSEVEFSEMQRQAGIRAAKIRQRVTKLLGVEHLALARIVYNGHNYDRRVLSPIKNIIATHISQLRMCMGNRWCERDSKIEQFTALAEYESSWYIFAACEIPESSIWVTSRKQIAPWFDDVFADLIECLTE